RGSYGGCPAAISSGGTCTKTDRSMANVPWSASASTDASRLPSFQLPANGRADRAATISAASPRSRHVHPWRAGVSFRAPHSEFRTAASPLRQQPGRDRSTRQEDQAQPPHRDRMSRILRTAHGDLALPAFLPDATRAVVRTLDSADLAQCGVPAVVI